MPKDRFILKQFAGGAENNGVFGSYAEGAPTLSNDPEELQKKEAWGKGWASAVSEDLNVPRLEEMQGVQYVICKAIKNLYSAGISPWDERETYFKNALCVYINTTGDFAMYKNITGKNTSTPPELDSANWENLNIGVDAGSLVPVGTIISYAGETMPPSYLACDGSFVPKDKYGLLYKAIGNRFYETLAEEDKRQEQYEAWINSLKENKINPMVDGLLFAKYSAYMREKEKKEAEEKKRIQDLNDKLAHSKRRMEEIKAHYIHFIKIHFIEVFSFETLIERLKADKTPEDSYPEGHALHHIWKNEIWKWRDEYLTAEKEQTELPPLTEYNYYKNVERKARLEKEKILATHFALPNLNDGKFLQGADVAGKYNRPGLPNFWGNSYSIDPTACSYRGSSGGVYLYSGAGGNVRGGNYSGGLTLTFDASACSNIYGDSDTVQPPAVEVRYLIKYK